MFIKEKVTSIIIGAVAILLIIYDIIVAITSGSHSTISHQMMVGAGKFPFIATAWGVLFSHFFLSKQSRTIFRTLNVNKKIRLSIFISISVIWLLLNIVNSFHTLGFVSWQGDNLYIPAFGGMVLGLFWYQ